jgi:predicted Zn-dependent peptidase
LRRLPIALVLSLLFLVPALTVAQDLESMVSEFTLDNGMEFIVVERPVAPVFFGAVIFKVGSLNEWDGVTGISHLLEHMMFKGTETVGTKSYSREKKYLEREDQLALAMSALKLKIGNWRFEIFEDYSRELISRLDEETKEEIGSDKAKELAALLALLDVAAHVPPEAELYPNLMKDKKTDYMGLYLEYKQNELALEETMVEHRDLIVSEELWDAYLQNGARMVNAFTSNDVTAYIAYLPANRLELWMMMESDRMKDPVFREFYSERNVVAEERRLGENDPDDQVYDALMRTAFQASPYGRSVVGWMSDIQSITRQELMDYQRLFYAPNNAVVLLVGDVDPAEVKKKAARYFGRIPPQPTPPPVETIEPEQMGERRVEIELPSNPQVMIGYHVPTKPHPDAYALDVLEAVLGQGRTSRFHRSIYEEQGLTSESPRVSREPGMKLDNLFTIQAAPKHPHTTEEVEAAIYAEIERIQQEPPTEREIQRVRNSTDASMVRSLGSNFGLAFSLGMSVMFRGDWRAYLEDIEKVKMVEPEDVSRVAAKYLVPRNRSVVTLVKVEEAEAEGAEPEGIDMKALMQYVRSLPQEEQMELYQRFQSMNEQERIELGRELMERMKAESGAGDDGDTQGPGAETPGGSEDKEAGSEDKDAGNEDKEAGNEDI